jgi:Family of unknown function (DUF5662)
MEAYDSTADTQDHINKVQVNLSAIVLVLLRRAFRHDQSKLEEPEKSAFDIATPKLKGLVYGSDEYRSALREIKPALVHHYAVNDHHPEHYGLGLSAMSLFAVLEMLADWKAAGERHDPPTDFAVSLETNINRFKIPLEIASMLEATAKELGWLSVKT